MIIRKIHFIFRAKICFLYYNNDSLEAFYANNKKRYYRILDPYYQ